jgi:hypothetical protein
MRALNWPGAILEMQGSNTSRIAVLHNTSRFPILPVDILEIVDGASLWGDALSVCGGEPSH